MSESNEVASLLAERLSGEIGGLLYQTLLNAIFHKMAQLLLHKISALLTVPVVTKHPYIHCNVVRFFRLYSTLLMVLGTPA